MNVTRRDALTTLGVSALALAAPGRGTAAAAGNQTAAASGPYALAPLPYAFDALEPHIDARIMELHHGKHHAAYVAQADKALDNLAEARNQTVTP